MGSRTWLQECGMDELSQDSQVPSCLCSMEGTQGSSHVPKAGVACSQESYWEPVVVRSPPWSGVEWVISPDLGWELQVAWSHDRAPRARPPALPLAGASPRRSKGPHGWLPVTCSPGPAWLPGGRGQCRDWTRPGDLSPPRGNLEPPCALAAVLDMRVGGEKKH